MMPPFEKSPMNSGALDPDRHKENLIILAADGQLEKSNPGCSDMDSGHSPDIKCASLASWFPFLFNIVYNICIFIGILPKITEQYITSPHSYPRIGGSMVYVCNTLTPIPV